MDKTAVAPAPVADRVSFSVNEFAARHRLSRASIYNQIAAGRLTARKVGTATRITLEDERAWLDSLPRVSSGKAA